MNFDSKLAASIAGGNFIVTAELRAGPSCDASAIKATVGSFNGSLTAANVADNHHGIGTCSLAVCGLLSDAGVEPVYQVVTRDWNRISLQSDLLGAAALGVRNVLCLSGCHQTLGVSSASANVYDIDSTQLAAIVRTMRDRGQLADGTEIQGAAAFCISVAANPSMRPLELNMLSVGKKVEAGADSVQTQASCDTRSSQEWPQWRGQQL